VTGIKTAEIATFFKEKSFRATPQRIAVYKYIYDNPHHPDVDEIYKNVLKDNPSFSKTTVYNSLQALEECGLIIPVRIDSQRIHYDVTTALHGHFICKKCKRIFDFSINGINCDGINDFAVEQKDVYYSGLCPECK
jgi:Fur family peroxide stress response transcriptional regulator